MIIAQEEKFILIIACLLSSNFYFVIRATRLSFVTQGPLRLEVVDLCLIIATEWSSSGRIEAWFDDQLASVSALTLLTG